MDDPEILLEAVQAFRMALGKYALTNNPLDWAMTQNNLGFALLSLGEREPGTAKLDAAAKAFCEAQWVYAHEKAASHLEIVAENLGRTKALIAARQAQKP